MIVRVVQENACEEHAEYILDTAQPVAPWEIRKGETTGDYAKTVW